MADAKMLNLERVKARLASIPKAVHEDVQRQLDREIADLTAALQRAAPVSDLEGHPGELRDSIQFYPTPDRPLSYRVIAGARDSQGRLYGRYVEFGHIAMNGKHVPAAAFWFPTYRARRRAIRRRLSQASAKRLKALFPGEVRGV